MYKYTVVTESLFHQDIGNYVSYGILCTDEISETTVSFISDVSSNKNLVDSIADKFTEFQLSPIHLREAIEDELP